jgi:hypothetical protein
MIHSDRPTQIATSLEMLRAEFPADMMASLETYMVDLEARQPDRPDYIAAILKAIGSGHSTDTAASLEAYIADLEARQQTRLPGTSAPSRDSVWLYWHGVKRAKQHQERALRKQNNHQ